MRYIESCFPKIMKKQQKITSIYFDEIQEPHPALPAIYLECVGSFNYFNILILDSFIAVILHLHYFVSILVLQSS